LKVGAFDQDSKEAQHGQDTSIGTSAASSARTDE